MKIPLRGDKPKKLKSPEDSMTLFEHLAELRTRIIRSALAIVAGIIVMMAFYDQVLRLLLRPYRDLCESRGPEYCDATLNSFGPLDGFTTRLSVSMWGGILLALPVILWQVWRFVVPALHAREKRYAIPFVLSSVLLFAFGGFIAYFILGKSLEFLIDWSGAGVEPTFQVSKYISLVMLMVAAFGIGFEFPVLLVFLQIVGVIKPRTLLKQWRYATIVIFTIAAVITPSGDPFSMLALALPMWVFYLIAVGIGALVVRHRNRSAAAE